MRPNAVNPHTTNHHPPPNPPHRNHSNHHRTHQLLNRVRRTLRTTGSRLTTLSRFRWVTS